MGAALTQEVRTAIGFKQQPDLVTPLTAADMWSLRQTNTDLIQAEPVNEDDSKDLGKGVYAENVFASYFKAGGPWNGRLTAESAAMLVAFGLGNAAKVATVAPGGFKYTSVAPVFATDGLDLPPTTLAVQIRTGASAITDKAIIGAVCDQFGFQFTNQPGRDSAQFTSTWKGTGKNVKPSAIVIPALYVEHALNAGLATTLTMVGFDYLANKRFSQLQFDWNNNTRAGFFLGSGSQSGYQIEGRQRRGVPAYSLKATVECDSGSSEEDALLAQTEGTGVIDIQGGLIGGVGPESYQFKVTFQRLRVLTTKIRDDNGIASYDIEYSILRDAVNGVCTFEIICTQDNILAVGP